MQCTDFEQVIEESGLAQLSDAARAHAAGCPSCTALASDLLDIVAAAGQIPAEVNPPARVWVALRAQLEAEGIIRPLPIVIPAESAPWWKGFSQPIRGRILATVGVAALVLVAGVYQMRRTGVADVQPSSRPEPFAETATTLDQEEQSLGAIETASTVPHSTQT